MLEGIVDRLTRSGHSDIVRCKPFCLLPGSVDEKAKNVLRWKETGICYVLFTDICRI